MSNEAKSNEAKSTETKRAEASGETKSEDRCKYCGSGDCSHLWPQGRKCCPDCTHEVVRESGCGPFQEGTGPLSDVTDSDGKYRFFVPVGDYKVHVYRHGEPWLVLEQGSKAILGLMMDLELAREKLAARDACAVCAACDCQEEFHWGEGTDDEMGGEIAGSFD